jgi:LysR family transcriptional activator of nhaA
LTEAGYRVLSYADEIFSLGQELLDSVKHQPTARQLRVHIGITDSLPKSVSYEIIKPIFTLDPPAQALCREGKVADLLAQLAAYRLDIVLADEPAPSSLPMKVFNHLLGECGVTFCAAKSLSRRLKAKFPHSLSNAPVVLPPSNSILRQSLEKWFRTHDLRPRLVAEFDDAALMQAAAAEGLGFFAVPTVAVDEAVSRHGCQVIGAADDCSQQFYAISAERKLTQPAVLAITQRAQSSVFS